MPKVTVEHEIMYEVGDVVLFERDNAILVGVVEGYHVDSMANHTNWYNIRTWKDHVFTPFNGGDTPEWDILYKLEGEMPDRIKRYIVSGKLEEENEV